MWPNLWCFLDSHAGGIQAAAAVVTFVLTVVLVGATLWANHKTNEALRLTREQFEREWRPGLHVRILKAPSTNIQFVNIGRIAIVPTALLIRFPDDHTSPIPCLLDFALPAGEGKDSLPIYDQIRDALQSTQQLEGSVSKIMRIDIGVSFIALDQRQPTRWFPYSFHVRRIATTGEVTLALEATLDPEITGPVRLV